MKADHAEKESAPRVERRGRVVAVIGVWKARVVYPGALAGKIKTLYAGYGDPSLPR